MGIYFSDPAVEQDLNLPRLLHEGNMLSAGSIEAVDGVVAGTSAAGALSPLTHERWVSLPPGSQSRWTYVSSILGRSDGPVDCMAIAGHNLHEIGAQIRPEFSFDITTSNPDPMSFISAGPTIPVLDGSPILYVMPENSAFHWQLKLFSLTGAPVVSVIRFGKLLTLPAETWTSGPPPHLARQITSRTNLSESGNFLGISVQRRSLGAAVTLPLLSPNFVRDEWTAAQVALEEAPAFFCARPDRFDQVVYGMAAASPVPAPTGQADFLSVNLELRGLL